MKDKDFIDELYKRLTKIEKNGKQSYPNMHDFILERANDVDFGDFEDLLEEYQNKVEHIWFKIINRITIKKKSSKYNVQEIVFVESKVIIELINNQFYLDCRPRQKRNLLFFSILGLKGNIFAVLLEKLHQHNKLGNVLKDSFDFKEKNSRGKKVKIKVNIFEYLEKLMVNYDKGLNPHKGRKYQYFTIARILFNFCVANNLVHKFSEEYITQFTDNKLSKDSDYYKGSKYLEQILSKKVKLSEVLSLIEEEKKYKSLVIEEETQSMNDILDQIADELLPRSTPLLIFSSDQAKQKSEQVSKKVKLIRSTSNTIKPV